MGIKYIIMSYEHTVQTCTWRVTLTCNRFQVQMGTSCSFAKFGLIRRSVMCHLPVCSERWTPWFHPFFRRSSYARYIDGDLKQGILDLPSLHCFPCRTLFWMRIVKLTSRLTLEQRRPLVLRLVSGLYWAVVWDANARSLDVWLTSECWWIQTDSTLLYLFTLSSPTNDDLRWPIRLNKGQTVPL